MKYWQEQVNYLLPRLYSQYDSDDIIKFLWALRRNRASAQFAQLVARLPYKYRSYWRKLLVRFAGHKHSFAEASRHLILAYKHRVLSPFDYDYVGL